MGTQSLTHEPNLGLPSITHTGNIQTRSREDLLALRTGRDGRISPHPRNIGAPTPVRKIRAMPPKTVSLLGDDPATPAHAIQDVYPPTRPTRVVRSDRKSNSRDTSPVGNDVHSSPGAFLRQQALRQVLESLRDFEGGIFEDSTNYMTRIRNWRRLAPAELEKEPVGAGREGEPLRYRLGTVWRVELTHLLMKIAEFTQLATKANLAVGDFVVDPRGDLALIFTEKGWSSPKEFSIAWNFLDQRFNSFEKHFDTIKKVASPSREFDESRMSGLRSVNAMPANFTDPGQVEEAWSTEMRPTRQPEASTPGWATYEKLAPPSEETTFVHRHAQPLRAFPVPRPSINVAAGILTRDNSTMPYVTRR